MTLLREGRCESRPTRWALCVPWCSAHFQTSEASVIGDEEKQPRRKRTFYSLQELPPGLLLDKDFDDSDDVQAAHVARSVKENDDE